jgi:hypothetical protein
VGHFRGSENPVLPSSPMPREPITVIELVWPKIKLEKVENFRRSNRRHLRTTIHHIITTISPANYHQKKRDFPEPPSKHPQNNQNRNPATQNFFLKFQPKKPLRAKSKIKPI